MNMGIVDRLRNFGTKHERTNIVRDDSDNVKYIQRDNLEPNERRTSEMLDEYYEKNPTHYMKLKQGINEKIKETRFKIADDRKYRKETRAMERLSFREGKRIGSIKRANTVGFNRGFGIPRQPQPTRQPIRQVVIHEKGKHGKRQTRINYAPQEPMVFDMMTGRYVHQPHQQKQQDKGDMVFDMWTGRYVHRRR
jgi:hypothetical protein